ncbi:hypothetical protein PC120_g9093 [Phytophthora cactorum]|nr:hypothetical protein PC120_g9093 [Phytophthora cactorum]
MALQARYRSFRLARFPVERDFCFRPSVHTYFRNA